MASVSVKGVITEDGRWQIGTPLDLAPGPVEVEIRSTEIESVTLGEILDSGMVGLWVNRGNIGDSVEFARELRRRVSGYFGGEE